MTAGSRYRSGGRHHTGVGHNRAPGQFRGTVCVRSNPCGLQRRWFTNLDRRAELINYRLTRSVDTEFRIGIFVASHNCFVKVELRVYVFFEEYGNLVEYRKTASSIEHFVDYLGDEILPSAK